MSGVTRITGPNTITSLLGFALNEESTYLTFLSATHSLSPFDTSCLHYLFICFSAILFLRWNLAMFSELALNSLAWVVFPPQPPEHMRLHRAQLPLRFLEAFKLDDT